MTAKDLIELVGVEKSGEIVSGLLSKYLEQNLDVYESFVELIIDRLMVNEKVLSDIEKAMGENIVSNVKNGGFDILSNEKVEKLLSEVGSKIATKMISAI